MSSLSVPIDYIVVIKDVVFQRNPASVDPDEFPSGFVCVDPAFDSAPSAVHILGNGNHPVGLEMVPCHLCDLLHIAKYG